MINFLYKMLDALTSAYSSKDRTNLRLNSPIETNIGKLFSIISWGFDKVQEQSELIKLWDNIDNAKGEVLDRYGRNFGVQRLGATDRYYRLSIKIKLLSQLSGGDIDTMLNAAAALFEIPAEKISLTELFPSKISIDVNEADLAPETVENVTDVVAMLKRILAAGIELITTLCSYRELRGNTEFSSAVFDRSSLVFDFPDARREINGKIYISSSAFEHSRILFSLSDAVLKFAQSNSVKSAVFCHSSLITNPAEVKRQIRGPAYSVSALLFEHTRIIVRPID